MTDNEIKELAREYGVHLAKDIPLSNCLKNEVINSNEDYIIEFFGWLSDRYCLVEKSEDSEGLKSGKSGDYEEGFRDGAKWHESLSLADKISDEEETAIREFYRTYQCLKKEAERKGDSEAAERCEEATAVLEWLFGKDLFTDKSE